MDHPSPAPEGTSLPDDLCARCGQSRGGSLFACPHCGEGAVSITMEMSEDEHREYHRARQAAGAERRSGFLLAILSVLCPFVRLSDR